VGSNIHCVFFFTVAIGNCTAVLFDQFYSSKLKLMNVNNLTKNVVGEMGTKIWFYILIYYLF
jgi:hypothetical protein